MGLDLTEQQAQIIGECLKDAIFKRTGIPADELWCPREKSDMTPCVARDGGVCAILDTWGNPICVGCETHIDNRLVQELER